MKKQILRSMMLVAALFVTSMASAAIDWTAYSFIGDGAGGGKYTDKYKMTLAEGMTVVNIQQPGFATEAGIYCTFPAAVTDCSVAYAAQGAGAVIYLSAFTAQETEVTVTHANGTSVFTVYYADGTLGGDPTPAVESYTIEFNDVLGLTGSDQSQAATTIADVIKSGAEYVSDLEAASVYRAREGYGVKFGTGSKAGSLTLTLAEAVMPDSIVLTACSYSASEGALVFMGDMNIDATNGGADNKVIADYKKEYDGKTSVSEITIATSAKRAYVIAVTVYPHKEEVKPTPDPAVNLALNKPVVAGYSATPVAEAVDGNLGSRWASGGTHWSAENPDQGDDWMYVDLGQAYNIGKVKILFETAAPTDYDLLYSNDAEQWTVMGTYVGQPKTGNTENDYNEYNFSADKISAQYIKIFARQGFANLAYGISIWEFEVYEAVADNEKPVLTAATIDKIDWNQVTVNLTATDNVGVTACKVVDEANGVNGIYPVKDNVLAITGLSANKTYNFTINAMDDMGNISDNAVTLENVVTPAHYTKPQTAAPTPEVAANLVLSVYSDAYTSLDYDFQDWGGGYVETKESIDGNNYNYYKASSTAGYLGMALHTTANAATMLYWHLDIWAEDDMTVDIFPIDGKTEHFKTATLKGQQWNSIDLKLADYTEERDWANVYQIKLAGMGGKTIAVDNIYFYRDPIADDEIPTDATASVVATSYFTVTLACSAKDNSGVVNFDVFNGETKVATGGGKSEAVTNVVVANLQAGTKYNLSVVACDANDNKAAAVSVEASTLALPAAAVKPLQAAEDVYAVYSDAYAENHTPAEYNQGWWANPTMTNVVLGEQDNAILYTSNGDPNGCFGWAWGETTTDLTGYNKLHIDLYAQESGSIMLGITRQGGDNITETPDITAGEWNAIDIDLTDQDLTKFFQIGFWNFSTLKCFFVDNVYFYKDNGPNTGIESPAVTENVQKYIINGQLIIVRDGVRYNALGQVIE